VKSRWIIGLLMTCVLAISAGAQENGGAQPAEGTASPATQLQAPAGLQDGKTYPEQLEAVLEAMTAELGEIAQAAREGKISRAQAEYLSLERYYVALTRFQFLRTLYQDTPQGNQAQSYAQANPAPQIPSASVILPPRTCSPDIPGQLVSYLELSPQQVEAIQAQVTGQCEQVQPLMERLEESRRKEISIKLSGKFDVQEAQALAAEQSGIIKQLIVANSQLETKLYSMLTSEQQRKVDGLLRQSLNPDVKLPFPEF
jgi:Spy/CpxP family protein refolding chaperone